MRDRILKAAAQINEISEIQPELGLVLGTGLRGLAESCTSSVTIPYEEIEGFGKSTAPSHAGKLVLGKLGNKKVVIMQGRLHYYEGYSLQEVTFPIRVLTELGIKLLILTNAAGSLNPYLLPGNLVLIRDHINFMGNNPLIGRNDPALGERFPSMHNTYEAGLRRQAIEIARKNNFDLPEGVYVAVSGPSLETRAESLMLRNFGADVVGMSTVPEAIVAIHGGMQVLGFSIVTNLSNIFHNRAHDQQEIQDNASKNADKLKVIIEEIKLNT